METAREFRQIADRFSEAAAFVTALPVPSNDRVWHRVRSHTLTRQTLIDFDYQLVHLADQIEHPPIPEGPSPAKARTPIYDAVQALENVMTERLRLLEQVP